MNDPLVLSVIVPCVGSVIFSAIKVLFSISVSFKSTPGAIMFSVLSSFVL